MATATQASGVTVHDRVLQIFGPNGFLEEHNVERKVEIELLGLAVISGTDLLLLGERGVGKTYLLEMFTDHGLAGADLFNHMIFKESGVEELIGPRSVQALKNDEIRRITAGFLPEAHTAVIDEVFKGSASVLNALLDLFASRKLKVGGKPLDCKQLITIVMASNELPASEDLQPFRDRIDITKVVEPVKTAEGRKRVRQIQLGHIASGVTPNVEPLTLDEILQARAEADAIELPESVGQKLDKAQEEWLKAGHAPSQRRMKSIYRVVKANAWMMGRGVVTEDDLLPAQHMAWNHLEDQASARKVILKYAGQFSRKVDSIKTKLMPKLGELDTLRAELSATQDASEKRELYNKVYDVQRDLKGVLQEAEGLQANGGGQDTTDLDKLVDDMRKAKQWAERLLVGDEE